MNLTICLDRIPIRNEAWDYSQRDVYDILMDFEDRKLDHYQKVTVLFENLNRLAFKSTKRNGHFLDSDGLTNGIFDTARNEKFFEPLQERAIKRLTETGKFEFITVNGDYRGKPYIRVIANWASLG